MRRRRVRHLAYREHRQKLRPQLGRTLRPCLALHQTSHHEKLNNRHRRHDRLIERHLARHIAGGHRQEAAIQPAVEDVLNGSLRHADDEHDAAAAPIERRRRRLLAGFGRVVIGVVLAELAVLEPLRDRIADGHQQAAADRVRPNQILAEERFDEAAAARWRRRRRRWLQCWQLCGRRQLRNGRFAQQRKYESHNAAGARGCLVAAVLICH